MICIVFSSSVFTKYQVSYPLKPSRSHQTQNQLYLGTCLNSFLDLTSLFVFTIGPSILNNVFSKDIYWSFSVMHHVKHPTGLFCVIILVFASTEISQQSCKHCHCCYRLWFYFCFYLCGYFLSLIVLLTYLNSNVPTLHIKFSVLFLRIISIYLVFLWPTSSSLLFNVLYISLSSSLN